MILDTVLILVLVLLNGFFVAAEFAIVKVRSTQIETIKDNNLRARIAKDVIDHLDAYLSATQLGITIASIALGWVGEPAISRMIEPLITLLGINSPKIQHAISFGIGFSVITFLHITVGELAPKSAAIQFPKQVTLLIALPLKAFYLLFRPFIGFLNYCATLLLRLVGIHPVSGHEVSHSEEEIRLLIADGRKSGVIDATEYKLIENIFDFTETTAREIMIPRTEAFAIDVDRSYDENFKLAIESGFTRIPVYRETIDSIVGILYVKDLFKIDRTPETSLEKIVRPVYFAPESMSLTRLMQDFLQQKAHLAVVIDEFGGTSGIVTLENILEKIVGQIQDEYDDEKKDFELQVDGSFLVNAKIRISEFNRQFQTEIPDDQGYETMAGFLSDAAGHIPHSGEVVKYTTWQFTITKKSPKQILQFRVKTV